MRIFNFVNFDNLIYMKLYNLLILNKIQKCNKNNVKALKKTKQALFPRRILGYLFTVYHTFDRNTDHLRRHDQSNNIVTSIAAALNWSENGLIGVFPAASIVCSTLGRRH